MLENTSTAATTATTSSATTTTRNYQQEGVEDECDDEHSSSKEIPSLDNKTRCNGNPGVRNEAHAEQVSALMAEVCVALDIVRMR